MVEVLNYIPDNREFSDCTLDNGLKCYFIRDPSADKVNIALTVSSNCTNLPHELIGLNEVTMSTIWRGSERYPGSSNFRDFVHGHDIEFRHFGASERQTMAAAGVPAPVVDEYLDRVADMITNPTITWEAINCAKMKCGGALYKCTQNDELRISSICDDILSTRGDIMLLFNRKDLVYRVRDFFFRNYCPSKMTLLLSGDMSLGSLHQLALEHFAWIPRNTKSMTHVPCTRPFFHPSDERNITLARGYTRNDTKLLNVSFSLPAHVSPSSALFIEYLLISSRVGSLQHKLKSEGLIKAEAAHVYLTFRANEVRTLDISLSQTLKGTQNPLRILSLLMGFIELIKKMEVSENLFIEAHHFFVCLRKNENEISMLDHMCCEIDAGGNSDDLRYPEIPHKFDPTEIKLCAESLVPKNCVAVALSNEYASAPVKILDMYLQYLTEEIRIEPCCDGLSVGNLDPLIAGCQMPLVEDSDLHLISPNVYLRSIAGEFFSTLKFGIKSLDFSKYSLPVQTLYAELINHKLWLVTNCLFDIRVNVEADTLSAYIKCPPESVGRIMSLVCGYLSKPIEDTHAEKLMELKQERERVIDMCLSGELEYAYQPEFDEILKNSFDPAVQKQQLQAIRGLTDLPRMFKGEITLLFGGNAHPLLALEAAKTAISLHSNRSETRRIISTSRDAKRTISRKYFKNASICKIFDMGPCSYPNWASLNFIRRILTELFSNKMLIGSRVSSGFTAEPLRRYGHMWLVLRLSADTPELELERRLGLCMSEELPLLLERVDENFVRDFRDLVWEKDLITSRFNLDEEMSFLWEIVNQHPQNDAYFGEMRKALLNISAAAVRNTYELYLSRARINGTRTIVWKPPMNSSALAELEPGVLGVHRSSSLVGSEPSPKRSRSLSPETELAEMIMKTNDIMDMLGMNDEE